MTPPTSKSETVNAEPTDEELALANAVNKRRPFRFHLSKHGMQSVFGDDWFGLQAERFARFFGTPTFLIGQTVIVAVWIFVNEVGLTHFDVYPFILLNLMFSLQAAYAAPLILLAQTRQADRDKALAEADAQHREALAMAAEQRQANAAQQTTQLMDLMQKNTELTDLTRKLSEQIAAMTSDLHGKVVGDGMLPGATK